MYEVTATDMFRGIVPNPIMPGARKKAIHT